MRQELAGKKVIDIGQLVDVFAAQEGDVEHIIGKTGNGKTYEATRRALEYLKEGKIVYTTWKLNLPEYYDEREDWVTLFWKTVTFRRNFYRFDYKKNWIWLDIDRKDLVQFIGKLTDCIVFLDEGQDIFDSHTRITQENRKIITRTRHLHKKLIIISQRAQAVDINARANVTYYYQCVKTWAWFWPFATYFKVYRTEELDNGNLPIWEDIRNDWHAELWHSHFARKEVYDAYNSWYLRGGIEKSQSVHFEAYELNTKDKVKVVLVRLFGRIYNKLALWIASKKTKRDIVKKIENTPLKGKESRIFDILPPSFRMTPGKKREDIIKL